MTLRLAPAVFLGTCLFVTGATVRAALAGAPAEIVAEELGVIDFQVSAYWPGPVTGLVADLSALPAGNTAVFTSSPDNTSGTFHWSPGLGSAGTFVISFVTTAGGLTHADYTTLTIAASGTSALLRTGYRVTCSAAPGYPALYDLEFGATDDGGTSNLGVGVSWTNYDGCPDAPLKPGQDAARKAATIAQGKALERTHVVSGDDLNPQRIRAGIHRDVTAAAPTLSAWGNFDGSDGYVNCSYWVNPIDLVVEARSTSPESDLSLFSSGIAAGCGVDNSNVTSYTRAPRLNAPATAQGVITVPLNINVDAGDPDGEPIALLTADLSSLPSGNDAVFTESPDHSHGTLTWTPTVADSGAYTVSFRAANLFSAAKTTSVQVRGYLVTAVPVGASVAHAVFSASVWPNPVSPDSRLHLVTTRSGPVRVRLFDVRGRLIRELVAESSVERGKHEFPLVMEDGQGNQLQNGIYFFRVEGAEGVLMGRLARLK